MKLHNIIKENIKLYLLESLKTQKEKYGEDLVNKLKYLDPSKTYKYIDFICKLYNDRISENEIKKYINIYNEKLNKNLIDKEYRNINKFDNFNEFKKYIDSIKDVISNTEIKKQYGDLNSLLVKQQYWKTITTDKGTWNVYIPTTMDESIQIQSKDTTWCTQMENKNKNYFDTYRFNDDVTLYYFINQDGKTTKLYDQNGKLVNDHQILMYQIQVYSDNEYYEIFNNNDEKITINELYKETGINQNDYKWKPLPDGKYNINIFGDKRTITIKNDKLNGKYIEYYDNGNIYKIQYYKNNKLDGEYKEYYKNGNIYLKQYYKNDLLEGRYEKYFENGGISYVVYLKQGIKNGKEIMYYDKDIILSVKNYKDGKLNGSCITYYHDGNKELECNYKNDELDGKYIKYYENGNIDIEQYFKNGLKNGKYIQYYENGNRVFCRIYKDNKFIKDCDK